MERSPVIGVLFHLRVSSLLTVLGLLDYYMISHAYELTMAKGATVQLVFGFEYAILITMIANIAIKYVLHAAEMRADTPWENKAVFLLYTELVIGFIRVVLYVLFVAIMVRIYTLPLFAFRPMYYTMRYVQMFSFYFFIRGHFGWKTSLFILKIYDCYRPFRFDYYGNNCCGCTG